MHFSLDGNYIDSDDVPFRTICNFQISSTGYYITATSKGDWNNHLGPIADYKLLYTDSLGNLQKAACYYQESEHNQLVYDPVRRLENDILYVFGRNVITGLPSERAVAKDTICEAIKPFFDEMVDSIKTILERTPPELSADILETGMYLTGGSASIRNLDKLIAQETDLKVNTVKNPEASVIRGISLIVSDSQYKKLMYEPKQSSF